MSEKVTVVSTVDAQVGINNPELRFKADWIGKGMKHKIDKEILEGLMFDPGVEYMFTNGILYIDDMDAKIDLGIEAEGTTEPTNVIVWDEDTIKKYINVKPLHEFKADFDKLSKEQKLEVAHYMVKNQMVGSMDKSEYVQEKTGVDVITAVRLDKAAKEATKEA